MLEKADSTSGPCTLIAFTPGVAISPSLWYLRGPWRYLRERAHPSPLPHPRLGRGAPGTPTGTTRRAGLWALWQLANLLLFKLQSTMALAVCAGLFRLGGSQRSARCFQLQDTACPGGPLMRLLSPLAGR